MLEVCFNDSVKGALILAQHCEDNLIGGSGQRNIKSKRIASIFL